jgi:hypothetical protein
LNHSALYIVYAVSSTRTQKHIGQTSAVKNMNLQVLRIHAQTVASLVDIASGYHKLLHADGLQRINAEPIDAFTVMNSARHCGSKTKHA